MKYENYFYEILFHEIRICRVYMYIAHVTMCIATEAWLC